MAWSFILTDLKGVVHGEVLQANSRRVDLPHMQIPTASFTMPLSHSLAGTVLDTDCLLRCYRTDDITGARTLAFHGPVTAAEEVAESQSQSVSVVASGPYWRLTRRIIPGSKLKSGVQYGSAAGLLDLGSIAHSVLTDVNGTDYTGIRPGTLTATTNGWVGTWWMKNAAEAISELHAGLNSFEFVVAPEEIGAYTVANPNNWPVIGSMNIAPIIGQSRPDAVFEYGTTRANVASYKRSVDRAGLLNQGIITPPGWPDGIPKDSAGSDIYNVVTRSDTASIAARGLFEEALQDAGILNDALRTQVADFHVALRKNPRNSIVFSPVPNARPIPFVDYVTGDTVRARAVVGGSLRFDALFRIWGVTFDLDQNGNEAVSLTLVPS